MAVGWLAPLAPLALPWALPLALGAGLALTGCTEREPIRWTDPVKEPAPLVALTNARQPLDAVLTGAAPTEAQVRELKEKGYRALVDLRTPEEGAREEGQWAIREGLVFLSLPIRGPEDLTRARAEALLAVLQDPATRPAAVVCASSNRVGALLAIAAHEIDGVAAEEALAVGQRAGLTALEPAVRARLGLAPKP